MTTLATQQEEKQQERKQRQMEARALLEGFWPQAFSFSTPKPLKVGITDELASDAEKRGLPFTREEIKMAVVVYTESYGYVRAISKGKQRYGMDGQPAGETTKDDRYWAQVRLGWKRYRRMREELAAAKKNAKRKRASAR